MVFNLGNLSRSVSAVEKGEGNMSQIVNDFSAFQYGGLLYSREGGTISIKDVKIDSNTGRIIYTVNGDSRDITDTLTSDEQTVLYQMAPSYQFDSVVASLKHGIQPAQWLMIGGAVLLTMLLIMRRR